MRRSFAIRLLLGTLLAALAVGVSSPVLAERAAWSQERVTKMAHELVAKVDVVRDAIRQGPQSDQASGQGSSFYRLKQDVRRIRNEARQLAAELDGGSGFEQTLPVYEDLMTLSRDVAENARRMFMPEPTLAAITEVGEVLLRITPYYASEPTAAE